MSSSWRTAAGVVCLGILSKYAYAQDEDPCDPNPCVSYGIDFQGGGSYFQNISSSDPFSFVSIFEGCEADTANNILVNDDTTDEWQCSDTALTPDDAPQLSTCPIAKDDLTSGDWSLIIISNNGDGCPIAYERDFYLTVGLPSTEYYTPTVPVTSVSTPIYNITQTQTSTSTLTSTAIVTSPAKTYKHTTTTTPKRVTTTKTITMGTIRKTKYTAVPTVVTKTKTRTCSVPHRQPHHDPWATRTPTLVHAAALAPTSFAGSAHRRDSMRRVPVDRDQRIAERKARRENVRNEKRGIDVPTTTITDTNSADWPTTTVISTASTQTLTVTTIFTTSTTSISTSTILSGITRLPQVTITAPTPTKTQTRFTLVTKTVATVTRHPTITITVHTAPPQSTAVCRAKGGKMVG